MGHVPPPPPPWLLTIDQQIAMRERDLAARGSRLPWRRTRAHRACLRLIELREHDLYGWHDIAHSGRSIIPPPKTRHLVRAR